MPWPITERVLSSTSYATLPDRRIIFSPCQRKRVVSFGTIVFCPKSQRWLLVRTRWSYAFTNIIAGAFQKSDLPVMFMYLTRPELEILRNVVQGKTPWREVCIGRYHMETERRFFSQAGVLKHYLQHAETPSHKVSTPWTFPKGRIETHETPYKCALREFEEETGLKASILGTPSFPDVITETYTSFDRFIYETRCWVFSLPPTCDEPAIVQPETSEIIERRWCTQEEAQTFLSPSKYAMLLQAKSRIDSEILTPCPQKPPYLPNYGEHVPVQPEESDWSSAEEPHCEG